MADKKERHNDEGYAKPDSQQFRAYYVQKRRKKRKGDAEV